MSDKTDDEVPGNADTSGSSSDEQSKPSNNNQSNTKKKRYDGNKTRFRGAEEKMNGHVYQVDGEPGKRPN
jgi:hypothetical protein